MDRLSSSRQTLQFVAEGVTALAGFGVAAISVVRGDVLETVAVAGDQRAVVELGSLATPVELVLREIEHAEAWGLMRFVPHDRSPHHLDSYSWKPQIPHGEGPEDWHPDDLLVGLLRDADGVLRGVLSVDLPVDGRRPGPEQRRALDHYARQAEQAVVTVVEREEYEAEMMRARTVAEERQHLIERLVHDLQNPVAAILGRLELMDEPESEVPEAVHAGMRAVRSSADRMRVMLEDLLRLSHASGSPSSPTARADLIAAARSVVDLLEPLAARSRLNLELRVEASRTGTADVPVATDDLHSVVENLLSNAIKYSEAGGAVVVEIRGAGGDPSTERVELVVSDEGIGIAEEDRRKVFDDFFRSADPAARRREGTGLGLAIVRRIVERSGGSIELVSRPGEGTTVTLALPRATASDS